MIIYFLLGRLTNRLKVGISGDFAKRLDGMRRQNFDDIIVLGTIPGDVDLEQDIHEELKSSRSHYEFYSYDSETKAVVDRYLSLAV
jgi:Meiotically up-regulated gene 113